MDFDDALAVFGLNRDTDWDAVRARYREAMRRAHPDLADGDGDTAREINRAFAVLEPVFRRGRPVPAPKVAAPPLTEVPIGVDIADEDLALIAPADEVFERLHRTLREFGRVTHVDRDGKYLEVELTADRGRLSVRLRGSDATTEALFTLETPPRGEPVHLDDVVRSIAARLRTPTGA